MAAMAFIVMSTDSGIFVAKAIRSAIPPVASMVIDSPPDRHLILSP